MKVQYVSDLHLEFNPNHYIDMPGGDVLILAGDVCVAANWDDGYLSFFEQCVSKYNKVFYVLGNHEFYGSAQFDQVEPFLRAVLPEGVTLLSNQSEYYNGVHFCGATMWTDFHGNKEEMAHAGQYMNDYRQCGDFTPERSLQENQNTIEWFSQCVPTLKKGPIVMISHHAPSVQSVHGRYLESKAAYSNQLEYFIETHPQITHWISGHIHHNNDYMIGKCNCLSNPRGYEGMEMNESFNQTFEFEV